VALLKHCLSKKKNQFFENSTVAIHIKFYI